MLQVQGARPLCCLMDTENGVRRCFTCNKEDHVITSFPIMEIQGRTPPTMTLTKTKNEQQASHHAERCFGYKCAEQGHLCKICTQGKVPKPRYSFHSYSLRRPRYYNCARTMISLPKPSTNVIWVPKALLTDLDGPILRWVPKCAH